MDNTNNCAVISLTGTVTRVQCFDSNTPDHHTEFRYTVVRYGDGRVNELWFDVAARENERVSEHDLTYIEVGCTVDVTGELLNNFLIDAEIIERV